MLKTNFFTSSPEPTDSPKPTEEMIAFSDKRTQDHIERVKKNMLAMEGYLGLSRETLSKRGEKHDQSKLEPLEYEPYIWLNWKYHCEKDLKESFSYPEGIADKVKKAIDHHVKNNRHHPEFHETPDAMSDLDLVEMICDWTAMSQEYKENGGSCKKYAEENADKKGFLSAKIEKIVEMIDELDRRNNEMQETANERIKSESVLRPMMSRH